MNLVNNDEIFQALSQRWKELDLNSAQIIKDANERGQKSISKSNFSKYMNRVPKGCITEDQLVWLLMRWGIDFGWFIGVPKIVGKKLVFEIQPYDELKCLTKINQMYGQE